ncbi:hypothetical protein E2C01_059817 [Portunus trituberculatus]|uniref:Uncharacterized protein n=1 Tax=Portunus trituberculatus TaxID=210409 RepID=A0A5B7H793_PORTR|nr:hypothetical protein [Portunus trituberculatus]
MFAPRFAPYSQIFEWPFLPSQSRPRTISRPILGQKPPQGNEAWTYKTHQWGSFQLNLPNPATTGPKTCRTMENSEL